MKLMRILLIILPFILVSCVNSNSNGKQESEEKEIIIQTNSLEKSSENKSLTISKNYVVPTSTQVLISYSNSENSTTGVLYGMEFINNQWKVTFNIIDCSLGRKGFANEGDKVEGDGKTPSGKFPLNFAFGYKDDLKTDMEFIELHENHYWVSDMNSEKYNRLINYNPNDAFSEKMKRNDHLYKYGIVIGYNTKKIVKGKGSAIFIHIERRKGSPTAGCIAISEEKMKELIQWVHPQEKPIIIMGEKQAIEKYINKY